MERRDIEEIVEMTVAKAVPPAVKHTLEFYGADVSRPGEMQRDFAWLRSTRRFFGSVATKILTSTIIVVALAAVAWAVTAGKLPIIGG